MLTIGILQADDLREELQPNYGCYADMFIYFLKDMGFNFKVYDIRCQQLPDSIDDCDGYLVTGSRHGIYDDLPWIEPLLGFIRQLYDAKKPVVGICFGHQAVAQALGGRVEKSPNGWGTSLQQWAITQPAPWMHNASENLRLLSMFQDQVLTLPPKAQRIAGNTHCKNGAFFIENHVFCIQGHPEFEGAFMKILMPYRQNDISQEAMKIALDNTDKPTDNKLCAEWIMRFFQQGSK